MRTKHILIAAIICPAAACHSRCTHNPSRRLHRPPRQQPFFAIRCPRNHSGRADQRVTVHDDRGRPVTGLTKDDFVLLDQGQRQRDRIFFRADKYCDHHSAAAPNVFTNRFEPGGPSQPPMTVIVLDTYNAGYWDSRALWPVTVRPFRLRNRSNVRSGEAICQPDAAARSCGALPTRGHTLSFAGFHQRSARAPTRPGNCKDPSHSLLSSRCYRHVDDEQLHDERDDGSLETPRVCVGTKKFNLALERFSISKGYYGRKD